MSGQKTQDLDRKSLKYQVGLSLRRFFKELDGSKATNVFEMVIKEVEKPMLEEVMKFCEGNKSKASKILGINRITLRTKLKQYNLDNGKKQKNKN